MGYKHEVIGKIEDERFFWTIKKYVPFLDQEIKIMFDKEDKDSGITENQVNTYLEMIKLHNNFKKEINKTIYDNYTKVRDEVEPKPPKISNPKNVWQHVMIDNILIPRLKNSKHTCFFLQMECDWEEEHGLEILFKDCKPISVGAQEGLFSSEEWDDYIKN